MIVILTTVAIWQFVVANAVEVTAADKYGKYLVYDGHTWFRVTTVSV